MKIAFAALFALSFLACGGNLSRNQADDRPDNDSCATAIKFPNAQMTEKIVQPYFTGDLNNYYGTDTTKLDIKHTFDKGKLLQSKFYYENGVVQEEYNFKCQSLHGPVRYFHKNGTVGKVIPYRYGRREGEGYLNDSLGNIIEKVIFKNDSLLTQAPGSN